MRCWMLWHGGASYAAPDVERDAEEFESIAAAVREFDRRANSWETYYPCVHRLTPDMGGPEGWLFFAPPNPVDAYPDRLVNYGPRGGVRVGVV